jgi:hypothetical protein
LGKCEKDVVVFEAVGGSNAEEAERLNACEGDDEGVE